MIVGGGMVGFYLANRLEKMGVDVKLIEQNAERCAEIADKLTHTMILNGDGSDLALLREEEAGKMDVVFAVTGQDDKNLLCSLLVKQLGAKKILSRVNRSVYIKLFEMVGVDRAVSPGQVTADAVLQRVIGGEEVITLSDERMELVDFIARPGAKIIGKTISKELPKDSLAGLVIRDGIPLLRYEDLAGPVYGNYIAALGQADISDGAQDVHLLRRLELYQLNQSLGKFSVHEHG
jgi:trk system potassium uptake protein TrkA